MLCHAMLKIPQTQSTDGCSTVVSVGRMGWISPGAEGNCDSQVELKNETLCWLETLLPDTDLFLWGSSDTNRVKICKYYFRIEWGKSQKKNVFFRALPTIWVTNLWWMSSQFLEKGDKSWHYQLQTQLYCSQGRIKDFLPECNEQYFAGKSRLIILKKISPHNTGENLTS